MSLLDLEASTKTVLATLMCPLAFLSEPSPHAFLVEVSGDVNSLQVMCNHAAI